MTIFPLLTKKDEPLTFAGCEHLSIHNKFTDKTSDTIVIFGDIFFSLGGLN